MFTVISRIIHYGVQGFWRNGWPSATTVLIMSLALLMVAGLIFFNYTTERAVTTIQDKIDISVYFKNSAPEDEVLNVKQSLESLPQVKEVDYISSDQALANFKAAHQDDPTIMQAVDQLDQNPLVASLNIKAQRPDQYADIAGYLNNPSLSQYIDTVSYSKNQDVIDRLNAIINNVNKGGLGLTIALSILAGLVVFNTIRLAIYSNREEIAVMRAVGASNTFVRGPYVVEGMISGVLAAVIGLILAAPIAYFVSPYLQVFIPGSNIFRYFYTSIPRLLGYLALFGVGIGSLSSYVAVKRYLKN